jgi:predicted TIM-barrel fold metal-dependent hydrolase
MSNNKIKFFDSNIWLDVDKKPKKNNGIVDLLLSFKKKYSIYWFILSNIHSKSEHPFLGNNNIAEYLKFTRSRDIEVYGAFNLEYDHIADPNAFEMHLRKFFYNGFRVMRLFPKSHKYPIYPEFIKRIYKILDHHMFPLILDLDELDSTGNKDIDWMVINDISSGFSRIPIIIDGASSKELMFNSFLINLVNNSCNVYLNIHNLLAMNQIEDLASIVGSKSLIFDTFYPHYDPCHSVSRIHNSDLSSKDKENISHLNFAKIIHDVSME